MIDISNIREEFPVTQNWVYFNHAGVSPVSRRVADAMRGLIGDVETNGAVNGKEWDKTFDETRYLAAELINSDAGEIAFVKNTTEGLSFVANGLDWHQGDNVVVASKEFPANIYPWLYLASKGVETRMVEEKNGRISIEELLNLIDENTRVVSLSSVEFSSGFRNDLETTGEFCKRKGIFFLVDAIQSLGVLNLDVQRCQIDALSADSHKWLLGPEGIGLFYCSKEAMERVKVTEMGWYGVINASDYLSYDMTLLSSARRFECGTLTTVGVYGLKAALELILKIGIQAIEERVLALTDLLCEGLAKKGYPVFSSRHTKEKSGIVSFSDPQNNPRSIVSILEENRVIIALRDGRIRVSPHFYNTEEEIEKLISLLPSC